jgi:hypothetical protein
MRSCTCKHCNKQYEVKSDKVDDGYCTFSCWEAANCGTPEQIEETVMTE